MTRLFRMLAALCAALTVGSVSGVSSAAEPVPGAVWTDPVSSIEFIWIAGGSFEMGCGAWVEKCTDAEKPSHQVAVKGFWLGKYKVTQGQWMKVMEKNPSQFHKGDSYPVDHAYLMLVQDLIGRLNQHGNGTFRLPTEAEWEYACRSGGKNDTYCGSGAPNDLSWNNQNTRFSTMPVGQKAPNGFGLFDMSGDLYERVEDCWHDSYQGAPVEGSAWVSTKCETWALRGGSWGNYPYMLRSTARRNDLEVMCPYIGVRLARSAEP